MIDQLRRYLADVRLGLERFCGRYYGTYLGIVIDNKDPQDRGRVRATCPAINMPEEKDVPGSFWIYPCMNGLGTASNGETTGLFFPPEVGCVVCIKFEFGDPAHPFYMGGFTTTKQTATTFKSDDMANKGPSKKGIRTKAGHVLLFNDDPDKLEVQIIKGDGQGGTNKQFIAFTKEGHTVITNKNGSVLYMNAEDNETSLMNVSSNGDVLSMLSLGNDKITLSTKAGGAIGIDGKDITLTGNNVVATASKQFYAQAGKVLLGDGASSPAVRGDKLQTWALAHQHTTTAPGSPTLTGAVPPPILFSELSEKVSIS